MKPVTSSQIHATGYDPETRTLAVQFHAHGPAKSPGSVYHYEDFGPKDWEAFQAAPSKYSHFHKSIKGVFKFTKQA